MVAGLRDGGSLGEVAAIEGYEAGPDAFSFVLRGKDPRLRLRVTQRGIDAAGGAASPPRRGEPVTDAPAPGTDRRLDLAGAVDARVRMTRVTPFQSAARSLQVLLHGIYAEDGRYPEALALDSPALAGLRSNRFFSGVAAIEDYAAGPDAFSFVLRGKDPSQRLRVTESTIEESDATTRP
jgi:hypothetical protein